MKDEIKKILVDVYQIDGRHEDEAAEQILRLFSVSERSKQLYAFLEYCDNAGWIKNLDKKRIVEDYEKANNF